MLEEYNNITQELTERIIKLIPDNPQILEIESPWDLFNIEGFYCKDLEPSLFQAAKAITDTRIRYKEENKK